MVESLVMSYEVITPGIVLEDQFLSREMLGTYCAINISLSMIEVFKGEVLVNHIKLL